jgi:hypothetical protein
MRDAHEGENPLVTENRIMGIRLTLAQAWAKLLMYAYDALLHHGVNYRQLPEYKDTSALDVALDDKTSMEQGRGKVMGYLERLTNGITAAVRRKGMKVH